MEYDLHVALWTVGHISFDIFFSFFIMASPWDNITYHYDIHEITLYKSNHAHLFYT